MNATDMYNTNYRTVPLLGLFWGAILLAVSATIGEGQETLQADATVKELPKAAIDGNGPGWVELGERDFAKVNGNEDTFSWKEGVLYCNGRPTCVLRTAKTYENFEMVLQWCHRKHAGNSGVFVWTTEDSIKRLSEAGKAGLPSGIEVQILDLGYEENWEKNKGKSSDWFTSHGDVFPVGVKMKPFPPLSADGSRSFPSKRVTKPHGNWNHYYIRAINGEVRLWVNGEEVSGGNGCDPSSGYLCLESEGAPIEFKNIRVRELP